MSPALLGSALTHRRLTSFLGLLGLWAVWVFILPNVAIRISQNLEPVDSVYATESEAAEVRWTVRKEMKAAENAFYERFYKRPDLPSEGHAALSPEQYREQARLRSALPYCASKDSATWYLVFFIINKPAGWFHPPRRVARPQTPVTLQPESRSYPAQTGMMSCRILKGGEIPRNTISNGKGECKEQSRSKTL